MDSTTPHFESVDYGYLPDIDETHEEEEEDGLSIASTADVSLPALTRSQSTSSTNPRSECDGSGARKKEDQFSSELENDADYDTDIEIHEETDGKPEEDINIGTEEYKRSCSHLNISPELKVVENLTNTTLNLAYQGIGENGAKALAKSLLRNTKVERLNLTDNSITPYGTTFLFDMLADNIYITYMDLSHNDVGNFGSLALKEMLLWNNTLLTLILKDCKIKDSDCAPLAEGLQANDSLVYLDLSHNEICEEGAMHVGNAISMNNSIEQLSLAWNHIRRKGAVQICKGLKRNYCLLKVDLSWNGLGYEGALSLSQTLKANKYIKELDVSNNRLSWNCASALAAGLKANDTLQVLKIGNNPLTMTGVLELLSAANNDRSEMEYMSFEGIPINRRIAYIAETMSDKRDFVISHGGILDTDDVMGKKSVAQDDPLTRLLGFLNDRSIRAVDLFRSFERDRDQLVSREQFIAGLKKAQAPLETWEIIAVMDKLDKTAEGKINYRKLTDGIQEQKQVNKRKKDRAKAEALRKLRDERKLLNPELSVNRTGSAAPPSQAGSISGSRRASRISLSIPMNQLERRRSSVASTTSLSSTLVTSSKVGRNISATRNPLSAVVESKQKDSREGEITRKLSRLSLPGSSGQNSRKASMAMVN
ncbi:leucine-rich repeat-containing protein 74B-like [Watersipora subatra]|uniref:leucine-rich repeat-containing protein 74B-like n=1 Tax=Watersipora subatra TaxID=2589382 RepID=UPI00355BA8A0